MSDTAGLQRRIGSASDLQSVVRTMRALAASGIVQYEQSVRALARYQQAVEWSLGVCLRSSRAGTVSAPQVAGHPPTVAIVFGSDQGLVGRFNDLIADHAVAALAGLPGRHRVWAVGERVKSRLEDSGIAIEGAYEVPPAVDAIAPLIGRIQFDTESKATDLLSMRLIEFHNRPLSSELYEQTHHQLLPLNDAWRRRMMLQPWLGRSVPEALGSETTLLGALIREQLFISLFRACAESLASENASRLAAMERADKNIDELLADLGASFHRQRQASIDEELFDVTAGYESSKVAGLR